MPAPLDKFLQYRSGGTPGRIQSTDEGLLQQLLAYDPNARFVDEAGGGDNPTQERYIVYDESKLPAFKGNLNQAREVLNNTLRDKTRIHTDENYGDWTEPANVVNPKDAAWVKYAPLLVSLAAPMAGGALAAAGIGAAGGTAGVTGGIAGLSAANIASGGQATLLSQLAQKAPQIARQSDNGQFSLASIIPMLTQLAGKELGLPSGVTSAGLTLAQLARRKR